MGDPAKESEACPGAFGGAGGNGAAGGVQGGEGSFFASAATTVDCGGRIPEPLDEMATVGPTDGLHIADGVIADTTRLFKVLDATRTEFVVPAGVTWIADGAFSACSNLTEITFLGDAPTLEGSLGADSAKCIAIYDIRRAGWTDADGVGRTNFDGLAAVSSAYPGDFYWLTRENADGSLTITGLQYSAEKELEVPMTLYGSREDLLNGAKRPVSALAAGLFKPCSELEQLTFKCDADALTMEGSLGLEGFRTVVSVPAGSKGWDDGSGLWQGCLIVWGDYLESFWLTEEIAGGVAITGTVRRASGRVELPETLGGKSVLKIGKDVFAGCDGLLGLDVPASVVEIAPHAFDGCSALANVVFYGDAPQPLDAPLGLSDNATVWVREDKAGWGLVPGVWRGARTAYVPGELLFTWEETDGGVKVTGLTLDDLTAVTVPAELGGQKVVEIGADAFKAAKDLKRVSFEGERPFVPGVDVGLDPTKCVVYARYPAVGWPDAEYAPQPSVWQDCRLEFYTHPELSWQTITLDDGTLAITGTTGAYGDLKGTAIVPGSINGTNVTAVAPYAFARYQDLTEVLLHPNVTTLGEGAFYKTPIGSLLLSSNVTAVATNALAGCTNLQTVYIASETPPAWMEGMGADPSNCIVYAAYDAPGWAPLPREIGGYAVEPCTHLEGFWLTAENADGTVTVTGTAIDPEGPAIVPATVRGKTVSAIGVSAFARQGALTALVLPKTLTAIRADAFAQSAALTNVTFRSAAPSAPEPVGLDPATCTVFAPYGSEGWDYGIAKWQGVPIVWYPAPEPSDEPASHPEAFWRTEDNGDGTLTVVGLNGTCEGEAIVPSKIGGKPVTALGAIFANCTNLAAVTISSNVTRIASGAFSNCTALAAVSFYGRPPAVKGSLGLDGERCVICYDRRYAAEWDDGSGRWQGCWLIGYTHDDAFWKTVENPDGTLTVVGCNGSPEGEMMVPSLISNKLVTAIAPGAFSNCTALTSLTVAPGIGTIGEGAFSNCTALAAVTLPEGDVEIGAGAFAESVIASIALPAGMTRIPDALFANCTNLTAVTFPTNLQGIGANAFAWCPFASLDFAASLAEIGANAFTGCVALVSLTFRGNAPAVDAAGTGLDGTLTTVYVMPGASGWGEIPGFWQGCPIFHWCDPSGLTTVTNDDGGLTVTGYNGNPVGGLEIPESIGGARVTMIAPEAFANCSGLNSVTVPLWVTNIGEYAFIRCDNLSLLTFGGNAPDVEGIGLGLFGSGTVVRVRPASTGWGEVPGIWQGCPTILFGKSLICTATVEKVTGATLVAVTNGTEEIPLVLGADGAYSFDVLAGMTVQLHFTADEGYELATNPVTRTILESGAVDCASELLPTLKTFAVTVPAAAHTTVAVTNGTTLVGTTNGVYQADYGTAVSVVYTAANGWSIAANASTNVTKLVGAVDVIAPTVTANVYTVTFASAFGTAPDPVTYTVESNFPYALLPMTAPDRVFNGWTNDVYTVATNEIAALPDPLGDIALGASWTPYATATVSKVTGATLVAVSNGTEEVALVPGAGGAYGFVVLSGTTVTLYFAADEGYVFASSNSITRTVTGNVTIGAADCPEVLAYMGVAAFDAAKTYDGEATNVTWTVTNHLGAAIMDAKVSLREQGTTTWIPVAEFAPYVDVTNATVEVKAEKTGYAAATNGATVAISPRAVTLTSGTEQWVFDGQAHSNLTVAVTGDGFVAGEGVSTNGFPTITDVGKVTNVFSYAFDAGTKAENYTVTCRPGVLSVVNQAIDPAKDPDPVPPGVDPDDPAQRADPNVSFSAFDYVGMYDGAAHTLDTNALVEAYTGLVDFVAVEYSDASNGYFSVGAPLFTDAVTTSFWYKVTSETFADIVKPCKVAITNRCVTLASGSESFTYDGEAHSNLTVTVGGAGFVDGEGVTTNGFATITDVGRVPNAFAYAFLGGTKSENYLVTCVTGTLEVVAKAYAISYAMDDGTPFGAWAAGYTAPTAFSVTNNATLPVKANVDEANFLFNAWTNDEGVVFTTTDGLLVDLAVYADVTRLWSVKLPTVAHATCVASTNGVPLAAGRKVVDGATVTFALTPDAGYVLEGPSVYTATARADDVTVATDDTKIKKIVAVEIRPTEHATFAAEVADGGSYVAFDANPTNLIEGMEFRVTVTPEEGYEFKVAPAGWELADGIVSKVFTVGDTDIVVTAPAPRSPAVILYPNGDGGVFVAPAKATVYEGVTLDETGAVAGTVTVKLGKPNRKGEMTVSATVKTFADKQTYTFKPETKKVLAFVDGPLALTLVGSSKKSREHSFSLVIEGDSLTGTFDNATVDGARNVFKDSKDPKRDRLEPFVGYWTLAFGTATSVDATCWVQVLKNGSVNIRGRLADGTLISCHPKAEVGDGWIAAPATVRKVVKGQVKTFAFRVAFDEAMRTVSAVSISPVVVADKKTLAVVSETPVTAVEGGQPKFTKAAVKAMPFGAEGRGVPAKQSISYAEKTGLLTGTLTWKTPNETGKVYGIDIDGVLYGSVFFSKTGETRALSVGASPTPAKAE